MLGANGVGTGNSNTRDWLYGQGTNDISGRIRMRHDYLIECESDCVKGGACVGYDIHNKRDVW
jgi:hypothetical protein